MSNPNTFAGVRINSNHVINEMRRINALEKRTFRHHASWGTYGAEFDDPCFITAGGGELFVTGGLNASPNAVRVFSPTGTLLRTWPDSYTGRMAYYNGELYCAAGVAGVKVYDIDGALVRSWAVPTNATDIAVDANYGYVYVLDLETIVTSQVVRYDIYGTLVNQWDSKVPGGTQRRGYGIAASRGLVFVDSGSATSLDDIYVWMADGTWMGLMGYADATVWQPNGALDAHDGIFLVCAPSTTYTTSDPSDPLWINVKRHGGTGGEYFGSGFYLGDNTGIASDSRFGNPFGYDAREDTTVAGDHDDTQTTLTVAAEFTNQKTAPFVVNVGATLSPSNEQMRVTSKAGLGWTVERGYNGTTAVGHLNGESVFYHYATDEHPVDGDIYYPTEICYDGTYCYVFQKWHEGIASGEVIPSDYGAVYVQVFTNDQTEFFSYTAGVATSLGTPDGGVTVPDRRALFLNGADEIRNHITDMRYAIESLIGDQVGSWDVASFAEAYDDSMGDRTAYGATGGHGSTWTKPDLSMHGTKLHDIDIGEVYEIVGDLSSNTYNDGWSYL